jgi:hypothetical protein
MPPPIRYPLPTLVALVLLGLLFWRGEAWTRPLRSSLAARVARVAEGPPVPHSDRPQVVGGPITRKALLLHDDVDVAARPGRRPFTTMRHRMFVDVYDVWPLTGEATHYRVGNRRPLGWVKAVDVLPWDTRLVIRRGADVPPAPLVAWSGQTLWVATFVFDGTWSDLQGRESVQQSTLRPEAWGVWLSREELLALIRRTLAAGAGARETAPLIRLRAVLGRLLDQRRLTDTDLQSARAALPAPALTIATGSASEASDRLARINEQWSPTASWGGLTFQFIPLEALP